jgi:ATPase subunit of ABC transporter with duplicated ATPase domains
LGTTIIIATHDKDLMKAFKGRHIRLEKGKIVEDTGPQKKVNKKKKPKEEEKEEESKEEKKEEKEEKDE